MRSEWWILALSIMTTWPGWSCDKSLYSNHSSNISIVTAPCTISGSSRYPSTVMAGNMLHRVVLFNWMVSEHRRPIGAHPYFLSPVLGAHALSSTKTSCYGSQFSLFARQCARSSLLRCAATFLAFLRLHFNSRSKRLTVLSLTSIW